MKFGGILCSFFRAVIYLLEQQRESNTVADLPDEIEDEKLYQALLTVDKHTLLKMQGYSTKEIAAMAGLITERALKLEEWQVHQIANSRKGYWRIAKILSVALTNKIIAKLGYISMLDYYLKVS
uniref:Uncharacterized protein n=1 Tax=Eubacterium plexicaudatum ASF492 TaxID=1235802 RepID=N2A0E4_9FIRM